MSYYYYDNNGGDQRRSRIMPNVPTVTRNLIIINVIVFVATLLNENLMVSTFGLFYPTSRFFHWWQPLTHMFMHGSFWHILFNMYTLYIFGCVVERIIGSRKFLVFYFICGLGAAALQIATQAIEISSFSNGVELGNAAAVQNLSNILRTPTVGASGAIYGVLIGYAMLFPESRMTLIFPPITFRAKWMVVFFAAIEFFTGVSGWADGVAHFAHLGGMLIGWLLILFWRKKGNLFDKDSWF